MSKAYRPANLTCPVCDRNNSVIVEDKDEYVDWGSYRATCMSCHARLTVDATYTVSFENAVVIGRKVRK